MTKEDLKNIIQNRYSDVGNQQLIDWVTSEHFEKDLDQFIQEDLEVELNKEHEINEVELSKLAEKVLQKSKNEGFVKPDSSLSYDPMEPYSSEPRKQVWIQNIVKVAAAILLIVLFTFVANYFQKDQTDSLQVVENIIKENQRGRKSTIFLKDGSIIYLNSESRIQFPEVFNDSIRTVSLEGEAYFDVARDESRPFIVKAGDLRLKVLGTSFNINAFETSDFIKVSLNSGKVELENISENFEKSGKIALEAGQSVSYISRHGRFTEVLSFDHDLDLAWKDGILIFKNADSNAVIKRLERWYGVDIQLQNSPYFKWGYTGSFENQTLNDVLESLSFSQSFEFEMDQNQVIITFKPN